MIRVLDCHRNPERYGLCSACRLFMQGPGRFAGPRACRKGAISGAGRGTHRGNSDVATRSCPAYERPRRLGQRWRVAYRLGLLVAANELDGVQHGLAVLFGKVVNGDPDLLDRKPVS